MNDELHEKQYKLRFGVERSIRYHARMVGRYETIEKLLMFATILMGSASVTSLIWWTEYLGGVAAAIAAFLLVYAPGNKAALHRNLHNRFSDLEIAMESECTEEKLKEWTKTRLRIEQNEPPIFWALNRDCHNEVCQAWDRRDYFQKLDWWKRATMYWFRYDHADIARIDSA